MKTLFTALIVSAVSVFAQDDSCDLYAAKRDLDNGITFATDKACRVGASGCLTTICRACRFKDTEESSKLPECQGAMTSSIDIEDDNASECQVFDDNSEDNIEVIEDPSCQRGGLGCITANCRSCGNGDSFDSSYLLSCGVAKENVKELPYVPKGGSATELTCEYTVSRKEAQDGVKAVTDYGCQAGGRGCVSPICRRCRATSTADYADLDPCHDMEIANVQSAEVCDETVSDAEYNLGIDLVTDTTCELGGLGCKNDFCRYCKFDETPQSNHFMHCDDIEPADSPTPPPTAPMSTPPPSASSGAIKLVCDRSGNDADRQLGIDVTSDIGCVEGGTGCLDSVCRLCKTVDTQQSAHLMWCGNIPPPDLGLDINFTPIGKLDGSFGLGQQSAVDSDYAIEFTCEKTVSSGDANVGLDIVSDVRCVEGGIGCIGSSCRFCQAKETFVSKAYIPCEEFDGSEEIGTDIQFVEMEKLEGEMLTGSGGLNPWTHEEAIPFACEKSVDETSAKLGISLISDVSCSEGGIGCLADAIACRECNIIETPQSTHLMPCDSIASTESLGSDIQFQSITKLKGSLSRRMQSIINTSSMDNDTKDAQTFVGWALIISGVIGLAGIVFLVTIKMNLKKEETALRKTEENGERSGSTERGEGEEQLSFISTSGATTCL